MTVPKKVQNFACVFRMSDASKARQRRTEQMESAPTAVSTIVALALFGSLCVGAKTVISVDDVQSVRVELDMSRVVRQVDERFLSVAIDASLITKEKFMNLLK